MSIHYTVLGFEPATFRTWVSSHNHSTRAPAQQIFFTCLGPAIGTFRMKCILNTSEGKEHLGWNMQPVQPDVEIKSSLNIPKVNQKVASTVFI